MDDNSAPTEGQSLTDFIYQLLMEFGRDNYHTAPV